MRGSTLFASAMAALASTRTKFALIPGTPGSKLLKKARLGQLGMARLR